MQEKKTNKNHNNNNIAAGGPGSGGNSGAADQNNTPGNVILKFEEDIKASIFNVMYILLKDSDISTWKYFLILIIEFLQMIQYSFAQCMKSAWKSESVFQYVSSFLNFTHILPWMDNLNQTSYLVIFYLCVFVITCAVLAFIYVSYSSSRLKTAFVWPQNLLRQGCFLIPTVLFIPFLELFTSMLVCVQSDDNNLYSPLSSQKKYFHLIYSDFQCWTGIHIIHATFAIAASIVIIALSLLFTLTFYKSLQTQTDAAAKSDSRPDLQKLIHKTILIYAYSFLYEEKQQWFLIAVFLVLSTLTFERYFYLKCFYNESVQSLQCILRSLCLWTNCILFLSKILQNTNYNGGIQLWLLGIPLAAAMVFFSRDNRQQEMLLNPNNFQQGEEVARQIRYFLSILQKRDSGDRNAEILLKGYIYSHEDTCPNSQCQLKQYKKNIVLTTQLQQRKGLKSGNGLGFIGTSALTNHLLMSQKMDNNQLLIQHAKNMFRMGLQKFPNSTALRISYSFFLFEKMNKKQEALQELNQASLLQPTFDEQFIIFRHKRLSDEFSDESQQMSAVNQGMSNMNLNGVNDKAAAANLNAVDMMARFAFESTFRQLQTQIEKCAHFHMEFWNYLKDDRPDLGKVGDCGSRIINTIMHVESIWHELQKLNQNTPKALKLYGRFLLEILHDRESGQEYLQKAKDFANMKQNYVISSFDDVSNIMQISSDGTPCVIVSGEPDRMSVITQCNSGAVRIFGYQSYELKNQKCEKLMPELYARGHQKILEEALQKGAENITNKERLIFAKHKSGYIFPAWIQLKLIQNIQNEIQFIALFKVDKKLMNSNIGFVIFNKEKKLQGISSSCIKMMGLDALMVRRMIAAHYDINKLSPDLEDQREELIASKTGLLIEWIIPFFQKKKWPKASEAVDKIQSQKKQIQDANQDGRDQQKEQGKAGRDHKKEHMHTVTKKRFKFLCTLTTISMGSFQEIGHFIRLEYNQPNSVRLPGQLQYQSQIPKKREVNKRRDVVKQPLFQFRFDIFTGKFIREIRDISDQANNKNPFFMADDFFKQSTDEGSSGGNPSFRKSGPAPKSSHELVLSDGTTTPAAIQIVGVQSERALKEGEKTKGESNEQSNGNGEATAKEQVIMQEDLHVRKKRWGKGIQIYALRDGKVQLKDYVDEEKRQMELEEQRRRKMEEEERNRLELANFTNNIKTKKSLKMALNDTKLPPAIKNLRFTMNIVIVFLIALAISEFTVISQQFQEISENFGMLQKSYKRISEVQRVVYDIRTIILINEGKLSTYQNYTVPSVDFVNFLKSDMETALNSLYDLQNYISLSSLSLSEPHKILVNTKSVPMQFKEVNGGTTIIDFTLTESVLQMSSAIFTIRYLNTSKYNDSQEDIYFVITNAMNGFLGALTQSSDYYQQELSQRSGQKNNLLLTLFLCSLGIVILSVPILFPAVKSVNSTKNQVLTLFIEIPNQYLSELSQRCQLFLDTFNDLQLDEIKSQDESTTHQGHDFSSGSDSSSKSGNSRRNVVKQPKNSSNTSKRFFFQFSFAVLLILAYFVSMFIIARSYINNVGVVTNEMTVAAFTESSFSFVQNTQREMFYNPNRTILYDNSFNISKNSLKLTYEKVQDYIILHQENRNVLNTDYKNTFEQIMNQDLCKSPYLNTDLLPLPCESLFNDAPTHGLQSVIIMYFELLRETLNLFRSLNIPLPPKQQPPQSQQSMRLLATKSTTTSTSSSSSSAQKVNNSTSSYKYLNTESFKLLYWMQYRFIQDSMRTLIESLNTATNSDFQKTINTKMAVFIVFIIIVILAYLMFWAPFVNRLNRDVRIPYNPQPSLNDIDTKNEIDVDDYTNTDYNQNTQNSRVPQQIGESQQWRW